MSGKYLRPWPSTAWIKQRPGYSMVMIREMTSVFLAMYLIVLIFVLRHLAAGPEAFVALLKQLSSPLWIAIHVVTLLGVVWHAITFFGAIPQAAPVFIGEKRVPGTLLIIAMGYVPWIVVSVVIMMLVCP